MKNNYWESRNNLNNSNKIRKMKNNKTKMIKKKMLWI